jgi:hypothetical protein
MTSGPEPRWTYAKPTEKAMPAMPKAHWPGEKSSEMSDYALPITRVEDTKNYLPVQKEQFWALEEIQKGDTSGTTETDSVTDSPAGNYATSQSKQGKPGRWPNKRS